jgi:hypothetical protein
MKRPYVIVPSLLALTFLAYFAYWSREDAERFVEEGPGALMRARAVSGSGIMRYDEPAIINDAVAIHAVVSLLDPRRGAWVHTSTPPRGRGVIRFSTLERTVIVQVGRDFVACGEYFRWLPPSAVAEIYEILSRAAIAPQNA